MEAQWGTSLHFGHIMGEMTSMSSWIQLLMPWKLVPGLILGGVVSYWVTGLLYNLYFHPLAAFPGPVLARSSLIWRFNHSLRGELHLAIEKEHRSYGPIIRVAPNELSFGSVESWKAIYGHPTPNAPTAPKGPFYEVFSAGFLSKCVGSERDPYKHGQMRKMLNPAFSQRSLLEQESIISGVVDKFIHIIGERAGPGSKGINMTKWFEMSSFDILGEMAFGESFHSIENGKPHFWADIIFDHLFMITLVDNLRRIGLIAIVFAALVPRSLIARNQNSNYSRNQVEKRLAVQESRKDFVSLLVEKVREGTVNKEEMTAHVSTLTIAGGETVSTFMAATSYFLLRDPEKLKKLTTEIRGAFQSYDDINAQAAQQLPYLQAVINEGLRLFPPGSGGAPRVSPGFQLHDKYIPEGCDIYTSPWTVTHDPAYFKDPMKFLPERWLDPGSSEVKDASQPFLLGPRSCLGRNFAIMEMNVIMTKMLWSYDLELVNTSVDWLKEGKVHTLWQKPKLVLRFQKLSNLLDKDDGKAGA